MELRLNIDYNQIMNLIWQLPSKDLEKLANVLQNELSSKKKISKKKLQEIILSAPTWSESDYKEYREARKQINKSRLV